MMLAIISASLIGIALSADAPPSADLKEAYAEARARATRSPDDQIKLALWCESHGLTSQKLHHLTLAILADPKNTMARGLLGLVAHDGRWFRPETIAAKAKVDPILAEYEQKRLAATYTADAQWTLGLWADERGLKEQAKAHFTAVTRLDPKRDLAWKKLGYKKHDGRWVTDAQLTLEKADAEAQKVADRKWKPLLEKYRDALRGKDESKRAEAEKALDELTDPRAARWVFALFASGGVSSQAVAVRVLGQIDSAAASRCLALLSVFSESSQIRRVATETLRQRDPREYADLLIALLQDEIKYEVRPVNGPGSPGVLFVEGRRFNVQRLYSPPPMPNLSVQGGQIAYDNEGYAYLEITTGLSTHSRADTIYERLSYQQFLHPNLRDPKLATAYKNFTANESSIMGAFWSVHPMTRDAFNHDPARFNSVFSMNVGNVVTETTANRVEVPIGRIAAEYQQTAATAQQQLLDDVAALDRRNINIKELNDRVAQVLSSITGKEQKKNRDFWKSWVTNLKGYSYTPEPEKARPTVTEQVPLAYQPQPMPTLTTSISFDRKTSWSLSPESTISCFGAGTPVQTVDGLRPIESLKVGDLVLSQSIDTGALAYKPILVVHHNPPSPTFRIKVEGEAIVSSYFHRFWVAGRGWVMARDLKAGDSVRTLGGVVKVESVEDDRTQLVYNLDVADAADFFVGKLGALVHDNTLPDPRLVPFDGSAKGLAVKSGN